MQRRLVRYGALCVVALALVISLAPGQVDLTWEQLQAAYDYDAEIALEATEDEAVEYGQYLVETLSFDGADGERVPAVLYSAKGADRPQCILFMHGYGGKKEDALLAAAVLLPQGFAVLAIDARMHGERKEPGKELLSPEILADGRPLVNTVIDNRRALDYLQSREDLDAEQVGLLGVSMGGILGGVLTAVDERIDAAALLVAGGRWDLVAASSDHPAARRIREMGMGGAVVRRMTATIDPVNFVGHISPRPVMMVNGEKDLIIPKACAEAMHEAAAEPKQIIWYDGGHIEMPPDVIETVVLWLATHVRSAPEQE